MDIKAYQRRSNKRPNEIVLDDEEDKIYRFRVLLPNGTSLGLRICEPKNDVMFVMELVKEEYFRLLRQESSSQRQKRRIDWKSEELSFVDAFERRFKKRISFKEFGVNKQHILRFCNLWNLTPDTDLLKELPEEYTFETALADLIDNSLQAVWSNSANGRKLISVNIGEDRISIFDTGPGMDGSEENSIVKWGKMCASLHRSSRGQAIGGSPPYLMPFFGMFGYGGPIASMHLGRRAVVSSKTKESKKVYMLYLEREALISSSGSEQTWRTNGGLRDPLEDEIDESFTKCDEVSNSGKTITPIEFEGKESIDNILEKLEDEGCGITENYESFSRVSIRWLGRLLPDARWAWLPFMELRQKKGYRAQTLRRCCPRVKCFIETDAGFNPTPSKTDLAHHHPYTTALKNFGNKPLEKDKEVRVEIYKDGKPLTLLQLERQYQDWILQMHDRYDEEIDRGEDHPLLIVSPQNKKGLDISSDVLRVHKVLRRKGASWKSGHKIKVLKGACAGCHKNNIYATLECFVLEGFHGDAGGEARLICRPLSTPDENGCLLSVNDGNASIDIRGCISLPISVIDSGKCLAIETAEWDLQVEKQRQKSPSSIEVLSAKHSQELEVEGVLPVDDVVNAGHVPPKEIVAVVRPASFSSASTSKNLDQKYISKENFEMFLEIKFRAEDKKQQDENHIYSGRITPLSRKGFHGLYIFPVRCKFPQLFQKSGVYTFTFSLRDSNCKSCTKRVHVKALPEVGRWELLSDKQSAHHVVRVGSCFPPISIVCYDRYENQIPFTNVPELMVKIMSHEGELAHVHKMNVYISSNKLTLGVKDLFIESCELDKIRPSYKATLYVRSQDKVFSVSISCQVMPGSLERVTAQPTNLGTQLLPGHVINEFVLEMFDAYGNHVNEDEEVKLNLDGFCFQDKTSCTRKVDDRGCVDLSGILKVTKGYGKNVSLSVLSNNKLMFKKEFQTEKRELRASSSIPKFCDAGSCLDNIVFEIINDRGDVDETIHDDEKYGRSHTLVINSKPPTTDDSVRYSFRHGRCVVRSIPLPQEEGIFCFIASHSRHVELQCTTEVHVKQAPRIEPGNIQSQCLDIDTLVFQDSSAFKTPKVERDDVLHQHPAENTLLLPDISSPGDVGSLVSSIISDQKELEDDMVKYGLCIGSHEERLQMLRVQQLTIQQDMSTLQASMDISICSSLGSLSDKDEIMERIECSKDDSAAAAVCKLMRMPSNQFGEQVFGVVALLGTVETNKLSRILAEYLGEDQMLAVVCKSYVTASFLERYDRNGNVNHALALYKMARDIGKSIKGRYHVICLENIRPYAGELGSDPQRKLALSDPTLPNGMTPPGYLGYAVNMIYLEDVHLCMRTASGHGLRETLFYHLFGELQVYETREHIKMAHPFINEGAVSFDGGILRGNGLLSLGCWEPEIQFPVMNPSSPRHCSQQSVETMMQMEAGKSKLKETRVEIEKETKSYQKTLKKFNKVKDSYTKFLDKKGPLLGSLEYRPITNGLYNSPSH